MMLIRTSTHLVEYMIAVIVQVATGLYNTHSNQDVRMCAYMHAYYHHKGLINVFS